MEPFNGFDVHISPQVFGTFCLAVGVLALYIIWRAANASRLPRDTTTSIKTRDAPSTAASSARAREQIEQFLVARLVMKMDPDVDSELKRMRAALECRAVPKAEIDRIVAVVMTHIRRGESGFLYVQPPMEASKDTTT